VRGFVLSLFVHAGILAAGLIYLPQAAQMFDVAPIIPIDLVTLGDVTSVRARAPEPEPVAEEETQEATLEEEIAAPPPAPEPEPEPEIAPEIIDETPQRAPDPVVEPEPEPEPEAPPPARTPPQRTPQPPPARPAEPSLADLLGNLERAVADSSTQAGAPDQGAQRDAVGAGNANTADLATLIRSHTYRCWRTVADMPNPETLGVIVEVRLNRDGTLSAPPRVRDLGRIQGSGNSFWITAAERAQTAVLDCAPYSLPADRYSQWRLIEVNFHVDLAAG
jgi:outer membrane biosynthesis protein TonB